jgi:homoserine kinase
VDAAAALVGRSVSVDVPATTANLGAGFDALALALDLSNHYTVRVVEPESQPRVSVEVRGEGAGHLPTDSRSRFVAALRDGFAAVGLDANGLGWRVEMDNDIPVTRGLGSSASASVGALVAADALLGGSALDNQRILELAAAAEGHADNAAAALHGGLCVVGVVDGRPRAIRIDPPAGLVVALYVPDKPLSTAAMRAALPEQVPFEDAVHNVGAAALAVAALSQGRLELLDAATRDRLHEPYRGASAYPELPELIAAARAAGAMGACLSGAGSAVIAFCDDPTAAASISAAMAARGAALGLAGRASVGRPRTEGARVIDTGDARPR